MCAFDSVFQPPYPEDVPREVEYFDVKLVKDASQGLGITIAGYVGRDNKPGMSRFLLANPHENTQYSYCQGHIDRQTLSVLLYKPDSYRQT